MKPINYVVKGTLWDEVITFNPLSIPLNIMECLFHVQAFSLILAAYKYIFVQHFYSVDTHFLLTDYIVYCRTQTCHVQWHVLHLRQFSFIVSVEMTFNAMLTLLDVFNMDVPFFFL